MKLSELNIKDIPVGLELISALGNPGKVTEVLLEDDNLSKEPQYRVRYDTINIEWESGKKSTVYHMQGDRIEVKNK